MRKVLRLEAANTENSKMVPTLRRSYKNFLVVIKTVGMQAGVFVIVDLFHPGLIFHVKGWNGSDIPKFSILLH